VAEPFKKYQCGTCGFIYDEADGLPDEGFPPGTRWADNPADWACPDCSMAKAQFDMAEID
jgi:rubredoxin